MNSLLVRSDNENENRGSFVNIALQSSEEKLQSHKSTSRVDCVKSIVAPVAGSRGKRGAIATSTLLNLGSSR